MATLTRGQKAAQTRLRNAGSKVQTATDRAAKAKTIVITADQFIAGIQKVTAGFEAISRIETSLAMGQHSAPKVPLHDDSLSPPKSQVNSPAPPPVSVLVDDVHSRSSSLRFKAESLRDAIVNGVNTNDGCQVMAQSASAPSQGPTKDALNFAFSNMCAVEYCLDEIDRYLLNR